VSESLIPKHGVMTATLNPLTDADISRRRPAGDTPETGLSKVQRDEAATLVRAYLRAAGVRDNERLNRLTQQALHRTATRPAAPDETLAQRAVEEARATIDAWLTSLLGLPETPPDQTLAAARAALRFAGETEGELASCSPAAPIPSALRGAVQAAILPAVPPPREASMPAQPIEFWNPLTRFSRDIRRIIKTIAGARRRSR